MTEPQRSDLLHRVNAGDADAMVALLVEYHPALRAYVAQRLPQDVTALAEPEDVLQVTYISAFQALRCRRGEEWRSGEVEGAPSVASADVGRAVPADLSTPANVGRAMPADPLPPASAARPGAPTFPNPAAFYKWLESIVVNDLHDLVARLHRRKRDVRRVVHGGGRDSMVSALQTLAAVTDSTPSRALARDEAAALLLVSLARLTEDQRAVVRLRFFEERPVAAVAAELHKSEDAVHALTYRALKELRRMLEGVVGTRL